MSCLSRPSFCFVHGRIFPFWDGERERRGKGSSRMVDRCFFLFFAERGEVGGVRAGDGRIGR